MHGEPIFRGCSQFGQIVSTIITLSKSMMKSKIVVTKQVLNILKNDGIDVKLRSVYSD